MSEKRYTLELGGDVEITPICDLKMTREQLLQHREAVDNLLAQAEANKPKAWDFGLVVIGSATECVIRGEAKEGWSCTRTPLDSAGPFINDRNTHVLGNLKTIVEQQGPIVVGFTPEQARTIKHLAPHCTGGLAVLCKRVRDALARYNRNKPEESHAKG